MVAQPRRIAAHGLHERAVRQGHGGKVGLRMGHGVREETRETRLWYVTTGYLVRLGGHAPESFAAFSHLVLDECHERSVSSGLRATRGAHTSRSRLASSRECE